MIVRGTHRGAVGLGSGDHPISAVALGGDGRRIPSRYDGGGTVVSDIAWVKDENREPHGKYKKGDDPGGQHLTDGLAQTR
jgi:hypothetical protein